LHRHGDRTPIGLYAKNVDRSFWYDSIGELTISGKLRMFNLGKYLRTRYANFLTGNPREVKIRSSMLVMAGAYPPEGRWVWNEDLIWQPFPIVTLPVENDQLLRPFEQKCRRVTDELNIVHSQYFSNITNEYEPLLNLLSEKTGVNFTNFWDILILYGILKPQFEMNQPLITNWPDKPDLDQLNEVVRRLLSYIFDTHHLQRLTA
ncbi:lysosomal acid phosphatase-like protein 3, partial [Dinothrombium tinctorium]